MENKHSLTLTCSACGKSATFTAAKRFEVVIAFDKSGWRSEPTDDGWSHTATCADCVAKVNS